LYAIVDIETTGGHASGNGITEIAIYIHNGEKIIDEYHSLINPEQNIPTYITALTGISNAMVASAPAFSEIADEIYQMLEGNIFIAHNVNFDYSFIKHHLKKSGYDLNLKRLCTVRLGRKVFPGLPSYSLGNFCRSMEIMIENRHRATGDAFATAKLFSKMLETGADVHIQQMLNRNSGEQWLPLLVDKQKIESLPDQPGVYYFRNNKGKVIYVGKAINIRKRVQSHFMPTDNERKRQHFLRFVTDISCTVCTSEMHALVLESAEIRRLWPRYNYSQKQPARAYALYSFEDNRGYTRLAIDKKKKNLPALYNFNLLHEGLVLMRKMIDEFDLNDKLCYLDKTSLSEDDLAFMDPPSVYNKKVQNAVKKLNEQLPTFAIIDDGLNNGEKICMLVERGSFYGMGYISDLSSASSLDSLKNVLQPYADNDFIRNSLYSFAEKFPHKKILVS